MMRRVAKPKPMSAAERERHLERLLRNTGSRTGAAWEKARGEWAEELRTSQRRRYGAAMEEVQRDRERQAFLRSRREP
jgi:hypothetical protein